MNISQLADESAELYMFVYNMGEKPVAPESYKNIFRGGGRALNFEGAGNARDAGVDSMNAGSILAPAPVDETKRSSPPLVCGLSLKAVRNAYKNPPKKFSSRATASSKTFNRSKNKAASQIGDSASFYIFYTDVRDNSETIKEITAECVYANDLCQVFLEEGYYDRVTTDRDYTETAMGSAASPSTEKTIQVTKTGAKKIAESFKKIYGMETALLGSASLDGVEYVDIIESPDKITILLSNLGVTNNNGITIGYFYANDFCCDFEKHYSEDKTIDYFSNQRQMFTLNTLAFSKDYAGMDKVCGILGHEFNHMINYINKTLKHETGFDTWFTELLSVITEDFTPEYLEIENALKGERIAFFNEYPDYGFVDWESPETDLYAYGVAYAFGAYLVRNYGGVKMVHEMATNRLYGKDSITEALKTCGYEEDFNSVFQKFGLVMMNADGSNEKIPTLNKTVREFFDDYTYCFPAIDLYNIETTLEFGHEPYFFWINGNEIYSPKILYGNGFYATDLGRAKDWNYSLWFSPPSNDAIAAYLYIKN